MTEAITALELIEYLKTVPEDAIITLLHDGVENLEKESLKYDRDENIIYVYCHI